MPRINQEILGWARVTSLRSCALALRRVLPLFVIEIIDPFQRSEIAPIAARFNLNTSVLAKWHPGEVQRRRSKRPLGARRRSYRELLDLRTSEARACTHRLCPLLLENADREKNGQNCTATVTRAQIADAREMADLEVN